jgi:hypothetical protein
VQINVQKANLESLLRQPHRQVGGDAALAHSAFAAHHQDLIPDAREFAAYEFFSGFFLSAAMAGGAGFLIAAHPEIAPSILIDLMYRQAVTLKVIFNEVNCVVQDLRNRAAISCSRRLIVNRKRARKQVLMKKTATLGAVMPG